MAEKNGMEMLSALMGEQGQDALKMMQRVQRLQRLMGPAATPAAPPVEKKEEVELFARNRKENMITAAIPFLNREYQRDLYIVVRLMEMQRVLGGGLLETRERQEEPPHLRQRKMLRAIQKYLPTEEQNQMQTILKFMDMKEIMEREGLK
ncbi:hypothetical protein [Anaerotignum sp.]